MNSPCSNASSTGKREKLYHLRLDPKTVEQLRALKEALNAPGIFFPMHCLVRRAVRLYVAYIAEEVASAQDASDRLMRERMRVSETKAGL